MSDSLIRKHWKKLAYLIAGLFSLLLLTLAGITFVVNTQSGTQWAVSILAENLNSSPAQTASFEKVEGTLFRGLSFQEIRLSNPSGQFLVQGLVVAWNPFSLLTGQLNLNNLEISSVEIDLADEQTDVDSEDSLAKPVFATISNPSPVRIIFENLQINLIKISRGGGEQSIQNISLTAELNAEQLLLSDIALTAEGVVLSGELEFGFMEFQPIQAALYWDYSANISNQITELAGQLELQGDLRSIKIEHQLFSPVTIQTRGEVDPGLFENPLSFQLTHSTDTLSLPMPVQPRLEFENIELISTGNLSKLSLTLKSTVLSENFPPIALSSQASYTSSNLTFDSYSFSSEGNAISGSAILDWNNSTRLSGDYQIDAQSIESFIDLPAQLNLSSLVSSGTFASVFLQAGPEGEIVIQDLRGQLGDYPVQGRGSIRTSEGDWEINQLQLLTQNNELLIDGTYADALDLSWEVNLGSLEEFVMAASGELIGKGNLTGPLSSINIDGQLSGKNLAFSNFSVAQLNWDFSRIANQVKTTLNIDSLLYSDSSRREELSNLNLTVSGTEEAHRIHFDTDSAYGDLEINVAGTLPDPSNPSWRGRILNASATTVLGKWATQSESALEISSSSIKIENSCWSQQEITLCASLQRQQTGLLSLIANVQDYPLIVFNEGVNADFSSSFSSSEAQLDLLPKLPTGVSVDGVVNGNLSMTLEPDGDPVLDFSLRSENARLLIAVEKMTKRAAGNGAEEAETLPQEYSLEVLTLAGNSDSGQWQFNAEASFLRENIDDSELDVRGAISAELNVDVNQALSGKLNAGLEDIRWLEAFVPELSNIGGTLNGQIDIGGSINSPAVTGSLELAGGTVFSDRLEITITDINANISSLNSESIQFAGTATSNSGSIQYEAELIEPLTKLRRLSAKVNGNDFQLINIPDLKLEVSPALSLTASADEIELLGNLDVPIFDLTLEQLPETAIDVSRDVVIVNYPSSRPDLSRSLATSDTLVFDIPLAGNIDISLGDQVSFTGFGMSTKLAGNLNIQQSATGSNLTYGELNLVDGQYKIYGRTLSIAQGKFLFFGAYDNPGLDIKATREVNDMTVGVLMNGTLKNINSQLFSTPALADNDIISVLVTGRPFSQIGQQEGDGDAVLNAITSLGLSRSTGLTNQVRGKLGLDVLTVSNTGNINNSVLTIGKYITPEIFVRYGVGLFDSQSKVAVDYSISDRIKLQAESGEFQSLDIIYSVQQ